MKLKKYVQFLDEFVKMYPEALDLEVIYCRDDEGNGFDPVKYSPTLGQFDEDGMFKDTKDDPNAVCIN
jgi:hypothetical protein